MMQEIHFPFYKNDIRDCFIVTLLMIKTLMGTSEICPKRSLKARQLHSSLLMCRYNFSF